MNDIVILGLLLAGPKHGYRLKREAAFLSGAKQLHNNTVYPLLKRYQERGWIKKKAGEGERGQTRLVYTLTAAGKTTLMERVAGFSVADVASAHEFRLRVGLFSELSEAERRRILLLRDEFLAGQFAQVQLFSQAGGLNEWAGETLDFVQKELQLERAWIARLLTKIERIQTL